MLKTAECLDIWRIPCLLHIFNKIFQTFKKSIKIAIQPIFDIINFLTNSKKYQSYIERKTKVELVLKNA